MKNEAMTYDVVIVGAGPAGLSAAIKIKQMAAKHNKSTSVCIIEKGAQVGSHIISGAVLDLRSLKELLPNYWHNVPLNTPVSNDFFYFLTKKYAIRLPTPKTMKNTGNYIISLGELCQFLANYAENMGCEIYPGFPAVDNLYDTNGQVIGIITGEFGIDKMGHKTIHYQPGMYLYAKQTLFAEGCRGELSQKLMQHFNLRDGIQPQTYGLGIKEIWQINPAQHQAGKVVHTIGWPMDRKTYGGSFIYHMSNNQVAIGFVVGLDYQNPWLDPFAEMQRFKTHPFIRSLLVGGQRISYGARAINEGGWQSLPKLTFPGGAIIGDAAGFLNVPKIKGIHTAMQSGILAAEACFEALTATNNALIKQQSNNNSLVQLTELLAYPKKVNNSWLAHELHQVRNIRPAFKYGLWIGLANAFFETYITHGQTPWTLKNHADHTSLRLAKNSKQITYPKPDNILTFDKLSSIYLANTYHESNQPAHLILNNPALAIDINYKDYKSPESRYCPAAVYEIVKIGIQNEPKLQINAQNCIHCKTCDIKDPRQNIIWHAPEGSGGPNYISM